MLNFSSGEQIPRIDYNQKEIETWGKVFRQLTELYPTHACKEHNHILPLLIENCGYREDNIPQLQDVSEFLKGRKISLLSRYVVFNGQGIDFFASIMGKINGIAKLGER